MQYKNQIELSEARKTVFSALYVIDFIQIYKRNCKQWTPADMSLIWVGRGEPPSRGEVEQSPPKRRVDVMIDDVIFCIWRDVLGLQGAPEMNPDVRFDREFSLMPPELELVDPLLKRVSRAVLFGETSGSSYSEVARNLYYTRRRDLACAFCLNLNGDERIGDFRASVSACLSEFEWVNTPELRDHIDREFIAAGWVRGNEVEG